MSMAALVYILCALTSLFCTLLLYMNYRKSRVKLLFWSSICFAGLALNNFLLVADMLVFPEADLSIIRIIPAFAGVSFLLWGLVWESI